MAGRSLRFNLLHLSTELAETFIHISLHEMYYTWPCIIPLVLRAF